MMFALAVAELLLVAIGALLFYNYYYKRLKLPPGPAPLPLIGNLIEIMKKQPGEDAYIDWKKQFGAV
ncbi:CBN-CYP-33D1 protein [Aphelenchoides avenae]|nr:CBN-CYP-33D1 protein [Aphelenchus avenae]KAH7716435.1 CBN-CYP-33D1 protein [Aphelenchus avenae]